MTYFVLSDVHSCYDALINGLNDLGFDKNNPNHKLLFLGDAFDKGHQHLETFLYFKEMVEKNKMIWILGNHDDEFLKVIENKKFTRDCHDAPIEIAHYYNNLINENSDINDVVKVLKDHGVYDLIKNKTVDYFELKNYIFTHGFIPTLKGKYINDWRNIPRDNWSSLRIRKGNGMTMILKNKVQIADKTLVCGHVGAYFGRVIQAHPDLDVKSKEFKKFQNKMNKDYNNYHTFISDKVINVDGNVYKTGIMNILIIKE